MAGVGGGGAGEGQATEEHGDREHHGGGETPQQWCRGAVEKVCLSEEFVFVFTIKYPSTPSTRPATLI